MVVAETALASMIVSPHETMTEPSASFAILPVSIEIEWAPICAVTLCCIYYFPGCARIQAGHPDCRCQFRGDCASSTLALPSALKPKTQGALSAWVLQFYFRPASMRKTAVISADSACRLPSYSARFSSDLD